MRLKVNLHSKITPSSIKFVENEIKRRYPRHPRRQTSILSITYPTRLVKSKEEGYIFSFKFKDKVKMAMVMLFKGKKNLYSITVIQPVGETDGFAYFKSVLSSI